MDYTILLTLVGVPILRSVGGWLENALDDGKISAFEWSQLGSTVIRVGMIGFATYFGLGNFMDVTAIGAAGSAVVMDFILSALKKSKKK